MRIGELAAVTGVSTRALRHYEAEGLLSSERAPNGYRLYSAEAARRVRNIRELLEIGFTISDVRAFTPYLDQDLPPIFGEAGTCATAVRVARERLGLLRSRIDALSLLHDRIAARLDPDGDPSKEVRAGSRQ